MQGSPDVLEGGRERVGVTIRQLGTVVLGLVWVVLNFFSHVFFNFFQFFNFRSFGNFTNFPNLLGFPLFFFFFFFSLLTLLTPNEPPFSEIVLQIYGGLGNL